MIWGIMNIKKKYKLQRIRNQRMVELWMAKTKCKAYKFIFIQQKQQQTNKQMKLNSQIDGLTCIPFFSFFFFSPSLSFSFLNVNSTSFNLLKRKLKKECGYFCAFNIQWLRSKEFLLKYYLKFQQQLTQVPAWWRVKMYKFIYIYI